MHKGVLLHGFSGHADAWDAVVDLIGDLPTWRINLLGHDPSAPARDGDTFAGEVDRIAKLLGDARPPWHLCGYSLGARIALGLLVRHPGLFASATLIGVHPGLGTNEEREARALADSQWIELLVHEGIERFADAWQEQPLFASQARLPASTLRAQRSLRLRHDAKELASALAALSLGRMPDFGPELGHLLCPVALLVGEEDLRFVAQAERMRDTLPHATLNIVPGAGHNLVLEKPHVVAAALRKGLTS